MKFPMITGDLLYIHPTSGGKLFQASAFEIPRILKNRDVYLLILAAREFQPENMPSFIRERSRTTNIIGVPLDDGPYLNEMDKRKIDEVANLAVMAIRRGQNVLSTCRMGLNRSGLISGVILKNLTEASSNRIIDHIRKYRSPKALGNRYFTGLLQNID